MYGDSFKSSLIAVVVPNKEQAEKWALQNGFKVSWSELCKLRQLQDYIISELKSTAQRNKVFCFALLFFKKKKLFEDEICNGDWWL